MASGGQQTEAGHIPLDARLIWVSTRKAMGISDVVAKHVVAVHPLHQLLQNPMLSMEEFAAVNLVALEVPPVTLAGFEHDLLRKVAKLCAANVPVAILVQPSLRKRTQRALWVSKWNLLSDVPFTFRQTCSCKMGNAAPGCHFTYYLGCNFSGPFGPCNSVPTLGASTQAVWNSLGGALVAIFASSLAAGTSTEGSAEVPGPVKMLRRRPTDGGLLSAGPHRTPDSALSRTEKRQRVAFPTEEHQAFPTEAKVREKAKQKQLKELGIEQPRKKRPKHVEDHYDDCGDDLTSLADYVGQPCNYDTEEEVSDQEHNQHLWTETTQWAFPIDPATVAQPQPGDPLPGRDHRAAVPSASSCPGCRHFRARNDWEHTREIGQCSYPHDAPWIPECVGCQKRTPRFHHDHTYEEGKCRWAAAGVRRAGPRKRGEPHDPQPKAHAEPTAGAPATDAGQELGQGGEEQVAEADKARAAQAPPLPPPLEKPPQVQEGGSSSSGSGGGQQAEPTADEKRAGRGPDKEQRVRRTYQDQGDNPERADDWSNFDIGRVVRLFRANQPSASRLTLRKLHVRWWHASEHTMQRFLNRVGVPQEVLDLIPEVVQTCRVCREWAKPGPSTACSVELADTFNSQVECDLLFVYKYVVFHMLDRCVRWHAAKVVPDKDDETLIKAIDEIWVTTHGAPKELIVDGESGITQSEKALQYLRRRGIKLHVRAKDQHARYIERRGALLRDTIHLVNGQLQEEGLAGVPFESILAEAVFCGNALLSINGSTPYNGVYGRVPLILPSIDQQDIPGEGQQPMPGLVRHSHRLREVSVQAMIEGSAKARLGRAMNTRTTMAAQSLDLKVGDEVDFYRAPPSKDTPGWYGPAQVVDVTRAVRGIVSVRYQSRVMEVQLQNVRRHLFFWVFLVSPLRAMTPQETAWEYIKAQIEQLTPKTLVHLGVVKQNGHWITTNNTSKYVGLLAAIVFFTENQLYLTNVVSARVGRGLKGLTCVAGFQSSLVLLWKPGQGYTQFVETHATQENQIERLRLHVEFEDWDSLRVLQVLMTTEHAAFHDTSGGQQAETGVNPTERTPSAGSTHMSPIPEGSHETEETQESLAAYLQADDPELQDVLQHVLEDWEKPVEEMTMQVEVEEDPQDRLPLSWLTAPLEMTEQVMMSDRMEDTFCEMAIYPPMTKIIADLPRQPTDLEMVVFKVSADAVRTEVVRRDDDVLTMQQVKENWPEILKSMADELRTWARLKCFSRRPRHDARNIIDTRWVYKFKWEHPTVRVTGAGSGGQQAEASRGPTRTIRARLTVRGFKDSAKGDIDRYAGTSSRCSQKLVVSEAVRQGWPICSADISKAFLQGVTYDELAKLTGEPLREVNFYLPASNIPLLRKLPGFENFDPMKEVLHCDKPGTGLVDAPRAFSIKLQCKQSVD